MINRAINGAYPPGSTFKPFMALAALEMASGTPESDDQPTRVLHLRQPPFRDDKKGGHGMVDMYKSIVHLLRHLLLHAGQRHGIDNIAKFMGHWAGQRTGVDIEGESEGVLPSPGMEKKRRFGPDSRNGTPARPSPSASARLQRLHADPAGAGRGHAGQQRRRTVRTWSDTSPTASTGEQRRSRRKPMRDLRWKEKNIAVINRAMVGVNKEGTGARAFAGARIPLPARPERPSVQSEGGQYKESAASRRNCATTPVHRLRPADKPKIALAVLVENGGFGAQSAAPIAHGHRLLPARQGGCRPAPVEEGSAANEEIRNDRRRGNETRLAATDRRHIDLPLLLASPWPSWRSAWATSILATYDANERMLSPRMLNMGSPMASCGSVRLPPQSTDEFRRFRSTSSGVILLVWSSCSGSRSTAPALACRSVSPHPAVGDHEDRHAADDRLVLPANTRPSALAHFAVSLASCC